MIPDQLPTLKPGKQAPGSGSVCAEQAVAWLVSGRLDLGDETDHPSCVQPVLNALAISVNDRLDDEHRHEMWPVILRQPGTAHSEMEPILSVRLAVWCAEQVLHLVPKQCRKTSLKALDTAKDWCECPCEKHAAAAYTAAHAAHADGDAFATHAHGAANAYAAANAAYGAAYATHAVFAAYAASNAAAAANAAFGAAHAVYAATHAATNAATASYAANDAACSAHHAATYLADDLTLIGLLTGAQAECERLTGHVPAAPDATRLVRLGELVGVGQP